MTSQRYFEISIVAWCGEFVCGRVTREFFEYWKVRTEDELSDFMTAFDPDERASDVPHALSNGTTPANWDEFDDIEHISNALLNNNIVRVTEVEPGDEDGPFRPKAGGLAQDFEIATIAGDMPDGFLRCVREIEVDQTTTEPASPVIVCKALAKGEETIAVCSTPEAFDIRRLSITYCDFDGDDVVASLSYDGVELPIDSLSSNGKDMVFYVGDLVSGAEEEDEADEDAARAPTAAKPPGRVRLLAGTLWPSFRTALRAIFSLFGFPVFLLAMIGAAKYLQALDLIELQSYALRLVEMQKDVLDDIAEALEAYGLRFPAFLADATFMYLSVGNTMARAEKSNLLSVSNDDSNHASLFMEWVRLGRVDSLVLSLPQAARDGFVRLFWPLMVLYRFKTPFVVEGPGPSDDVISSSVPRRELVDFAKMVTSSRGTWKGQSVQDFRQIFLWHVGLVLASTVLTAFAFSAFG